jgi:hypothetical protein
MRNILPGPTIYRSLHAKIKRSSMRTDPLINFGDRRRPQILQNLVDIVSDRLVNP